MGRLFLGNIGILRPGEWLGVEDSGEGFVVALAVVVVVDDGEIDLAEARREFLLVKNLMEEFGNVSWRIAEGSIT